MLYFGPYVTFQPRVRHILAHCTTSLFGPGAMPTNEHPHPRHPNPCHGPKVILGGKALKKKLKLK